MPQRRHAKQAGSAALDRLQASIEAAEAALKDLRGEAGRNSRDLLKDVGTTLRGHPAEPGPQPPADRQGPRADRAGARKRQGGRAPSPEARDECTARQRCPVEQGRPPHELDQTDSEERQVS
jgi:hypothetical protein